MPGGQLWDHPSTSALPLINSIYKCPGHVRSFSTAVCWRKFFSQQWHFNVIQTKSWYKLIVLFYLSVSQTRNGRFPRRFLDCWWTERNRGRGWGSAIRVRSRGANNLKRKWRGFKSSKIFLKIFEIFGIFSKIFEIFEIFLKIFMIFNIFRKILRYFWRLLTFMRFCFRFWDFFWFLDF